MAESRYKTAEELQEAIDAYFEGCKPKVALDASGNPVLDQRGNPVYEMNPPTITGLALALGFKDRRSIYDNEKREGMAAVISRARARIEEHHERLLTVKDRCTGSIFYLKNHGWMDERVLSGGDPIRVASVALSAEEEEQYKRNLGVFFGSGAGGE